MKSRAKGRRPLPTTKTIDAACNYALLGYRVVPLRVRSKEPRQVGWGVKATGDLGVIAKWPASWGDSNLGVATSRRLIALDVDPRHGGVESLARLLAEHGPLPETLRARTGSGGSHYLFRVRGRRRIGNRAGLRPGLDIRGEGGYIVVAPSVHPETGEEYTWATRLCPESEIAEAPAWLVNLLAKPKPKSRRGPGSPRRAPLAGPRAGDAGRLLGEMIAKFPITRFGTRHDQMTRAVGSLAGRGYGDALVTEVLRDWWRHFHEAGTTRSDEGEAARDLSACIASTRRSVKFGPAFHGDWHEDRCRHIRPDAWQVGRLRGPIPVDEGTGPPGAGDPPGKGTPAPTGKSVTHIGDHLCNSLDEESYVVALIVHATHRRVDLGEERIRMIDDQVRQIAAARRGASWRPWDNTQMARLKRKYVTSPEAAASRYELLRLVRRGTRGPGGAPGTPSEYEATGIEGLLGSDARLGGMRRGA